MKVESEDCSLRKMMTSPKVSSHGVLGVQHSVTRRQTLVACGTWLLLEHTTNNGICSFNKKTLYVDEG